MDSERFDAVAKALARSGSRRWVLGGMVAAAIKGFLPTPMSAQDEIAAGANGGTADAGANGGAVGTRSIDSGANVGNAIGVRDTSGGVAIDGGTAANVTGLEGSVDGGTGIADTSGGDDNVVLVCECPELACRAYLGCETGECRYEDPIVCPPGFEIDETTCTCAPSACPNVAICPGGACGPAGSDCQCFPTVEGGSLCVQPRLCADAGSCQTSGGCPVGEACIKTCCPTLTCGRPCGVASAASAGSGDHQGGPRQ